MKARVNDGEGADLRRWSCGVWEEGDSREKADFFVRGCGYSRCLCVRAPGEVTGGRLWLAFWNSRADDDERLCC
jgi:hypothetical protein